MKKTFIPKLLLLSLVLLFTKPLSSEVKQNPSVYLPKGYHFVTAVSALGDSIVLEDQSIWKVAENEGLEALSWQVNDPLSITFNDSFSSWYSGYLYKITNNRKNTSIKVNLHLGSVIDDPYSFQVFDIQNRLYKKEVVLQDNSKWEIYSSDESALYNWALNDGIIIGINTSYWSSDYNNILININLNSYVRAKQVQ